MDYLNWDTITFIILPIVPFILMMIGHRRIPQSERVAWGINFLLMGFLIYWIYQVQKQLP